MSTATHAILPESTDEARERWASLKDHSIAPGAFDDFDLVTGLAQSQDLDCEVLFASMEGEDRFGLVLPYRRIGPFRQAILPRFCPTSAILVDHELKEGLDDGFVRSALDYVLTRYHRAAVHVASSRVGIVAHTEWETTPLFTYVFDLATMTDDLTARWSAGTRRLYRRNVDSYRIEQGDEGARHAVDLCADGYSRSGRPLPVDPSVTAEFAGRLSGEISTQTYLARCLEDDDIHAGLIVLHHEETAFYWIAGSRPGPGMTVLIGTVLDKLIEGGTRYFDFLGANTPSIAEFKRRFGPTLQEYRRLSASRSRLLDLLLATRNHIRRVSGV